MREDQSELFLRIEGLVLKASIGIYPHELEKPQDIELDISWSIERRKLLMGDEIHNTVDYDTIVEVAQEVVGSRHFNLVETLLLSLEMELLGAFPIKNLELRVRKINAIPSARSISVSGSGLMPCR